MLPVTNHKAFHIPHSLATAAAIVALVTALGWSASDNESNAAQAAGGPLDQVTSVATPDAKAPSDAPAASPTGGSDCEPDVLSGLLPLVLPSVSGF